MERKLNSYEKVLNESCGGELGKAITKLKGLSFLCCMSKHPGCNQEQILDQFIGYPHKGGLANGNGEKYWPYWECPSCGHDWNYLHLRIRTQSQKKN